jgi:hypothetical protein
MTDIAKNIGDTTPHTIYEFSSMVSNNPDCATITVVQSMITSTTFPGIQHPASTITMILGNPGGTHVTKDIAGTTITNNDVKSYVKVTNTHCPQVIQFYIMGREEGGKLWYNPG